MERLKSTAKKDEQISAINYLLEGFAALMWLADGDESPLEQFKAFYATHGGTATPTGVIEAPQPQPSPAPQPQAQAITIEKGLHLVPARTDPEPTQQLPLQDERFAIPDTRCSCEIAVKEKDGNPNLCLVCKGLAYTKAFVFAHTSDGQRLLANPKSDEGFEAIEEPLAEYVSMPTTLAESTDDERRDIEQYA